MPLSVTRAGSSHLYLGIKAHRSRQCLTIWQPWEIWNTEGNKQPFQQSSGGRLMLLSQSQSGLVGSLKCFNYLPFMYSLPSTPEEKWAQISAGHPSRTGHQDQSVRNWWHGQRALVTLWRAPAFTLQTLYTSLTLSTAQLSVELLHVLNLGKRLLVLFTNST